MISEVRDHSGAMRQGAARLVRRGSLVSDCRMTRLPRAMVIDTLDDIRAPFHVAAVETQPK